MIKVRKLGHVALMVADLDRAVEFYEGVFGMLVSDRTAMAESTGFEEAAWLRFNSDHHGVALFKPRGGSAVAPPAAGGVHHFAFEIDTLEQLQAAYRLLLDRGVPIEDVRQFGPGCQLRIYLFDPDGHRIELYWDLDQVGWEESARPHPVTETVGDLLDFDLQRFRETRRRSGEGAPA